MPLDPKLEKRIDTLYRSTKQMPVLAIIGLFIPIALIIGGPLGLLYWFWRRSLLEEFDSGRLAFDPATPPLPSSGRVAELSSSATLDFIRSHKQGLLVPLYVLGVVIVLFGAFIGVVALTNPRA